MQPESFARWSPGTRRKRAEFIIRPGTERAWWPASGWWLPWKREEAAWRQTLTRTVRDGARRALFVAEARGQVVGYGRVVCVEADPKVEGRPRLAGICWGWLSIRSGGGGSARP